MGRAVQVENLAMKQAIIDYIRLGKIPENSNFKLSNFKKSTKNFEMHGNELFYKKKIFYCRWCAWKKWTESGK